MTAPRVYRRSSTRSDGGQVRWDIAIVSAQRIAMPTFYVGGLTALELLGQGHHARLGADRIVHL
nr:hypothetical protein [Sphingomonas crusticola]